MGSGLALRPIHPFPARMAASIALEELRRKKRRLRVLDPMAGSGTTLVVAKAEGHDAIGFDRDPLAVLLARAWSMDLDASTVKNAAKRVMATASRYAKRVRLRDAYPCPSKDEETRKFIRYWFDRSNRRELTCLARAIRRERDKRVQALLWCALSRLIITKRGGVSLAMDLAHSRPHRVRSRSRVRPFESFLRSVGVVLEANPFKGEKRRGRVSVMCADARKFPISSDSVDLVITSPPYLNAIDYLRCHKFTLVWMGYSISDLRNLRPSYIGSEVRSRLKSAVELDRLVRSMIGNKTLPTRYYGILGRYLADMQAVLREIARVLVPGGRAILVVGNSTLRKIYVRNSGAIARLGKEYNLQLVSAKCRDLPPNRRYLPPPSGGRGSLHNRIRREVVLILRKAA